ncbi:hypothetical protein CLV94_3363, partial [Flavobacterium endophyticum]
SADGGGIGEAARTLLEKGRQEPGRPADSVAENMENLLGKHPKEDEKRQETKRQSTILTYLSSVLTIKE